MTNTRCKICEVPAIIHKEKHPKLDFSKITEQIYIGTNACCSTHFDERLRHMGISADISLEAEQLDAPRGADFYLWLPTPDHLPPRPAQLKVGIAALCELIKNRVKVYVHCERGHGRAPTFIAAYFIKEKKMTPKQAVAFISKHRPITHLTSRQLAALKKVAVQKRLIFPVWKKQNAP